MLTTSSMPRTGYKVFKSVKKSRICRIMKQRCTSNKQSASNQKIGVGISQDDFKAEDEMSSGFRLIDLNILSKVIQSACACAKCGAHNLRLYDGLQRIGVVCTLHLFCDSCQSDVSFKTSEVSNWTYEANLRMCYGMRYLGVDREGTNLFCGIMNMPSPAARYTYTNRELLSVLEEECKENLMSPVQEAVKLNSDLQTNECNVPSTDLCVSCDSTWIKCGHISLHGVSSVISIDTGKILDLQVMSKHCSVCAVRKKCESAEEENKWQSEHGKLCCRNYSGSSGGMEAAAMKIMFQRSVERYGVRYVKYLGDGDSSSFKTVFDSDPYGPDCKIEKLECIGHIQKRMGGRLLKLKRELKGQKLEDGKYLGGPKRLTDKEIHTLQVYYGKAIRENCQSVEAMQRSVWAIYFHKLSTDENPIHNLCDISWCKFLQAKEVGTTYTHKHNLPEAVMNAVKPTFRFLANPDLL